MGVARWADRMTSGSYCVRVLRKMSGEGVEPRTETNGSEEMDTTKGGGELTFGWREFGNMKGRVALNFVRVRVGDV